MHKTLFVTSIGYLTKLYGKKPESVVLNQYWIRFRGWPDEKWQKTVSNIQDNFIPTSQNPFPLPAHFLQFAGEDRHSNGVRAIERVQKAIRQVGAYGSVDFGDKALHGVLNRYGGWVEVCGWSYDDWRMKERSFIDAYESAAVSGDSGPAHLPGIHELNNGSNGFDKFIPIPEKFGKAKALTENDNQKQINLTVNTLTDKMVIK